MFADIKFENKIKSYRWLHMSREQNQEAKKKMKK
jgi:hypothetical protein